MLRKGICAALLALNGVACSLYDSVEETSGTSGKPEIVQLREMADKVQAEIVAGSDPATGWVDPNDGDGVLWAGLQCAAGVPGVKIDLAEVAPGIPGRKAGRNCYVLDENGDGKPDCSTSTSRDMTLGYLMCLWRSKRLDLAQRLADACGARPVADEPLLACILGEPYPDDLRVVMTPNMVSLLGKVVYALSDKAIDKHYRFNPTVYSAAGEDYQRHLTALAVALHGETSPNEIALTDINPNMLEALTALVAVDPNDWTAQAVLAVYTGRYETALGLLLDPATPCPSYARGPALACSVSWLWAARKVLAHHPKE